MPRLAVLATLAALALTACQQEEQLRPFEPEAKDYSKPLVPGELALEKVDPSEYPDFSRGYLERSGLRQAIHYSLEYLTKPSSQRYYPYADITHDRVRRSLQAFLETLDAADSPEQFNALVRRRFDVYRSKGWDRQGTVYFTGYYTPIFEGRKQRGGAFQYPLYGMPPDLVKDEEGNILGRQTAQGLEPYPTRRAIEEQNLLAGHEIAWLKDPFEAYVVSVQGSAKLRLADGSLWELGYTANNGREYEAIALKMVADGVLDRDEISLQNMIRFFQENPNLVTYYTWQNPRYVFFAEEEGGPYGSIGVPVTPYRTIATDKAVFPRAALTFADTRIAREVGGEIYDLPFRSFLLDQDTGGAIRAAGRADIYIGTGERAEAVAGRIGAEGQLYYLFVREEGASAELAAKSD